MLGTIECFADNGDMTLKMDGGRSVSLDPRKYPHLDLGNQHDETITCNAGPRLRHARGRETLTFAGDQA